MLPWAIRRTLIHRPHLRTRVVRMCVTIVGMVFLSSLLALMIPDVSAAFEGGEPPLRARATIQTATVEKADKPKAGRPRVEAMAAPVGGWFR